MLDSSLITFLIIFIYSCSVARRTNEQLWADKQAPRKRGEGSVFPIVINGKNKFRATRTLYMDESGRAVQVSGTGSSEEEAIKRRDANYTKRLVRRGEIGSSAISSKPSELRVTFGDVLTSWLKWKKSQTDPPVSKDVIAQYKTLIDKHIIPHLGNRPIRLITRDEIRTFIFTDLRKLRKKRKVGDGVYAETDEPLLGKSRLRTLQSVVNMTFEWALTERIIRENPTLGIPRISKPESPAIRERLDRRLDDLPRLISYLDGHPDELRWMLPAVLGIRASEKLGLEWDCITNLDNSGQSILEIRQQLKRDPESGEIYISKSTKTRAGMREIPIPELLLPAIERHRATQNEWKSRPTWAPRKGLENLVFTTPDGKPIRHQTDSRQWKKLLKDAGLEPIRQHGLRHLAVSWMVANNMPIEIVKTIVGHNSSSVTRATYTHLDSKTKHEALSSPTQALFEERERTKKTEPNVPMRQSDRYMSEKPQNRS